MICGSLLVFFLSLLTLGVLSESIYKDVECGKNVEITPDCTETYMCNSSQEIVHIELRLNNTTLLKMEKPITVDQNCSVTNGRICLKVAKDRKRADLTIDKVTFADEGKYELYIRRSDYNTQINTIFVTLSGVCEPIVSPSEDEITCEVTMEHKTSDPTIEWMSKERKLYSSVTFVKNEMRNSAEWRITLKLTDETRQMEMCCTVSYTKSKREEKQTCLPFTAGSQQLGEDQNGTKIMIPILCILPIALAVALYVYHRHRPSFAWPRRERTDSEQGLMSGLEKPQEENKEETQSEPLQRPEDNV